MTSLVAATVEAHDLAHHTTHTDHYSVPKSLILKESAKNLIVSCQNGVLVALIFMVPFVSVIIN